MEDKINVRWRKSSYSGNGGSDCVEVAAADHVFVRDSQQNRQGPVLLVNKQAWRRFTGQLKATLPDL